MDHELSEQMPEHPAAAEIRSVLVSTTAAALVPSGALPSPAVHIFMEDLEQPYVGFVSSRPFYRGADAARALTGLGELPSALMANRILVAWEEEDLLVALGRQEESVGNSLTTLEATFSGHVVRRNPFKLKISGTEVLDVSWEEEECISNGDIPEPIQAAVDWWRRLDNTDLQTVAARMQDEGYGLNFVQHTSP